MKVSECHFSQFECSFEGGGGVEKGGWVLCPILSS